MSLQQNRRRIYVHGLDTFEVRETDPSAATVFSDLGFHESTVLADVSEVEDIFDETGNYIDSPVKSRSVKGTVQLLQTSKDEFDLLAGATGKIFAVRFRGLTGQSAWQYFCFPQARIVPSMNLEFKVGKRLLAASFASLFQQGSYSIPYYYSAQRAAELSLSYLGLWIDPLAVLNNGTTKILDMSGFERHGTLSSGYATMWAAAAASGFLRFNGTSDNIDFGDVLSIDGSSDFMIEGWFRIMGADGALNELVAKKSAAGITDGWAITREASNKIRFELGDGSASVTVDTSSSVLTNTWKHFAIAIDRNGNATPFLNGSTNGTPASVAALGASTSTDHLIIGKLGSGYGQIDLGNFRVHAYGSGNLPADIATVIANHFAAERDTYGV